MYNVPEIIKKSLPIIRDVTNNVDDLAILNCLNAKFANMITQKNILFRQYSNSSPRTLSYYAMNFQPSGSSKDLVVDSINDYLMPFIEQELKSRIEQYKDTFELKHPEMNAKQIKEELEKIRPENFEIANCTFSGFYKECYQLDKIGFGAICIRISELGDFISMAQSGDKGKAELLSKMKETYEGNVMPSIISGDTSRKKLKNINIQVIMYTDYENLFAESVKEYFLSLLRTGLARRCYVFIPNPEDEIKLDYVITAREKEAQFEKAITIQQDIKRIYDSITPDTIYSLSEESKQMLVDYQNSCIDYFNSSRDNMIVKLEKLNSFWKITKLAVVYSIIENPTSIIVQSKYVQMAIDFYKLISPSLKKVIEKRKKSEIEKYAEYIADHKDDIITRTDLRNLNYVHNAKFKKFFDEHLDEITEELSVNYSLLLYPYEGGNKSMKAYQVVKK